MKADTGLPSPLYNKGLCAILIAWVHIDVPVRPGPLLIQFRQPFSPVNDCLKFRLQGPVNSVFPCSRAQWYSSGNADSTRIGICWFR
jgi:hypothetical protein